MVEKRYAKVVNEETKACEVGVGTDVAFYKSLGMTEMEVERGWEGNWYVKGHAPQKPQSIILNEELGKQQDILHNTDWYAIRYADSGVEIPADIKAKRQAARERIDEIRAELGAITEETSATGKETLQVEEVEKVN